MEQPLVFQKPERLSIEPGYTNACETVSIFLHSHASICVKMTLSMSESDSRSNNIAILYVEDNADNRLLVRRILTAEGFCLLEAGGAQQALALLEKQTPDLILMDINMPDIDGYTLTARLKAMPQLKNVPIVAVTANALRGDRERSLEAGCDGYIEKPFDLDTLVQQVRHFLNHRALTESR